MAINPHGNFAPSSALLDKNIVLCYEVYIFSLTTKDKPYMDTSIIVRLLYINKIYNLRQGR